MCVGMCGEPAGLNRIFIGQAAVVEVDCAGHLWLVERRSGVIPDSAARLFGPLFKPTLVQMWPIVSRICCDQFLRCFIPFLWLKKHHALVDAAS